MKSQNTLKNYAVAYRQFLKFNNLNDEDITRIDPAKLSTMIDSTFENHIGNNRTKLTKISSVKSYIEIHFRIDLPKSKIRKDYHRDVLKKTQKRKIEKVEIDRLIEHFTTIHENSNQIQYLPTLRNLILIKLLAGTGQRISDILNLKISTAKKNVISLKQMKTGNDVSIENPCLPEILKYIAITKFKDDDFLFSSGLFRKPLSYQQAESIIRNESGKVFGKSITSHYFRSYAVSRLIELGYHPNDIMSVTGHTDTRMIDYYNKTIGNVKNLTSLLMSV